MEDYRVMSETSWHKDGLFSTGHKVANVQRYS